MELEVLRHSGIPEPGGSGHVGDVFQLWMACLRSSILSVRVGSDPGRSL